jgi:predicted nucleic acid-binding protein
MRTPLTIEDAIARALKDLAHRTNKPFKQVVNETLTAGLQAQRTPLPGIDNLASDAHLAALALEHGACVHSCDHNCARFPGLRHVDPLAD